MRRKLLQLLCCYAKADRSRYCAENDLVQRTAVGNKTVRRFLAVMRHAECAAAKRVLKQSKGKLTGSVECDATGVGKFRIKATNQMFQSGIAALEGRLRKQGKEVPIRPLQRAWHSLPHWCHVSLAFIPRLHGSQEPCSNGEFEAGMQLLGSCEYPSP